MSLRSHDGAGGRPTPAPMQRGQTRLAWGLLSKRSAMPGKIAGLLLAVGVSWHAMAADYFIATNGTAANPGTIDKPWTILSGLTQKPIQPGDTLWIRGGTYNNRVDFPLNGMAPTFTGSNSAPITIRAYHDEHVVINGYLGLYKRYITVRDLEFTDLSTNWGRPTSTGRFAGTGSDPFEPARGVDYPWAGIWVESDYCKVINCFIHDCPIGTFSSGANEWYGNVFIGNSVCFTNGDTDGEGLYLHNGDTGGSGDGVTPYSGDPAVIENNVFCYGARGGLNEWGSQLGIVRNVHNTNNIVLYYDFNCRAQVTTVQDNDIFDNIVAANPPNFWTHVAHLNLGYGTGVVSNVLSANNLIIGGALGYRNVQNSLAVNNTVCSPGIGGLPIAYWDVSDTNTVGMKKSNYYFNASRYVTLAFAINGATTNFTGWTNSTGMDSSSNFITSRGDPGTNVIRIFPNRYQPGRANIFVGNFQSNTIVQLDLSQTGLALGQDYDIHYLNNYFGPTLRGTYNGQLVVLPMTNWVTVQPKYVIAAEQAGVPVIPFEDPMPRWGAFVMFSRAHSPAPASDLKVVPPSRP